MSPDRITLTLTTADDVDAMDQGHSLVVIALSRQEIEAGLTGDALARLMALNDTPERVRRLEGRVSVLVSGYDNDPRELHQIPEVRSFFQALDRQWPNWLHFLIREHWQLTLILLMLVDTKVVSSKDGRVGMSVDAKQWRETILRLFAHMNALHGYAGIDEAGNIAISEAIFQALDSPMYPANRAELAHAMRSIPGRDGFF